MALLPLCVAAVAPARAIALHAGRVGNRPYGRRRYSRATPRGQAGLPCTSGVAHSAPLTAGLPLAASPWEADPYGLTLGSHLLWLRRGHYLHRQALAMPVGDRDCWQQPWPRVATPAGSCPLRAGFPCKGLWLWPATPFLAASLQKRSKNAKNISTRFNLITRSLKPIFCSKTLALVPQLGNLSGSIT
ncbi:hypothetical protein B296_00039606 [Ensete ventricosum]|uniref:Uncharacterized protein n=1 Tax=Ensete ventricosum TaxID=4639 RepID=A0A426X194_ENSVE|nr:hypothetical protein B296_00039606 [Ensete ventricosum]